MPRYTTRIELYQGEITDYELLDQEMKKMKFSTTIKDGFGHEYQLPIGEYNIETEEDAELVIIKAKKAASIVKEEMNLLREASILVSESIHREWVNLNAVS